MTYFSRHIEAELQESFRNAKAILVVGARQVGKTTLLKHLFPKVKIVTFDPVLDIMEARANPDLFLDSVGSPVILDEVQYAPELFPALKRRIDTNPSNGQFLLSGSQNPLLLKQVSESLAGRILIFELESCSVAERFGLAGDGKLPWLTRFLENEGKWSGNLPQSLGLETSLMETLWRGSLPDETAMSQKFVKRYAASYVQTYLERDVRIAGSISDIEAFSRFLALAAALSGQEINHSQFGREIGISPATAERWLGILKATFQWHEVPPWQGNTIKRIAGKPKGIFADTGIQTYLLRLSSPDSLLASPMRGAIFETFVSGEIRKQMFPFAGGAGHYHWRTNGGAEVDNVIEYGGKLHPFEVKCKDHLNAYDLRGVKALRETYGDMVGDGAIIYAGREVYRLDDRMLAIPWNAQ